MSVPPFQDHERIDARDKVRGATRYAADVLLDGMLFAMTVPATIVRGRLVEIPIYAALAVPGVVRVLTAADFPLPPPPGDGPPPPTTLGMEVFYRGEPVALVLAESLEAAIQGADSVRPVYEAEAFVVDMDDTSLQREPGEGAMAGDAERALAGAATVIEAEYEHPAQHHNNIELLSTVAQWSGGRLLLHEATQMTGAVKFAVAGALGLDPAIIDVLCPQVGGGFGQKGVVQRQTAIVARAAMLTGRPVKLEMPRGQVFHVASFRPRSRHVVRLGADAGARMVAARYDAVQQNSRTGYFPPAYHDGAARLYGIDHYLGTGADLRLDTQDAGYMRAPWEQAAQFAFESAVDELAIELGQDPVAFRIANDGRTDPLSGKPYSSRFLNECLQIGAGRFGWTGRTPGPGSMTGDDGVQVGWGVACGADATATTPAIATLRVGADGRTRFAISGHEMGQGMRTVLAQVLLHELPIDEAGLEIVLGDTTAAPQHLTAGAWGTASTAPVALLAAQRMRAQVAELLDGRAVPGDLHEQLARVRRPSISVEVSRVSLGQGPDALEALRNGQYATDGPEYPEFTTMNYIAHFVEVRIEPRTRRIRVPRVVSIADCGRVISPRTAASQVRGGVVWGIGATLREESEVDPRFGGFLNADLADYVLPVCADVGEIDVGFVDRPDPLVNTIGSKSLGVLTIVGMSAAIANAVFHATGTRVRKLPIRIEDLL